MKVAVVGAGKMGLPLACQIASSGAYVTACDKSAVIVEAINSGRMPFDEPGLGELLAEVHMRGQLRAVTNVAEGVRSCDVIIVLIPVLLTLEKTADLSIIEDVTRQIATVLQPGMMVSYETTLPVGTTRNHLRPILDSSGLRAGIDFDLVFSPERVKSRLVMRHLSSIPKIVGGISSVSAQRGERFYSKHLRAPVINVETLEAAEFAKLAGMIYRDVNIALANELAAYAESKGLDFGNVIRAANTDGESFVLTPGIGVGGHCTPVYPYFLLADPESKNVPLTLARSARQINEEQASRALDRLETAGVVLSGSRLVILGLGFRPEVKEHTCSPAFQIQREAQKRGAQVYLHDPLYSAEEIAGHGFLYWDPVTSLWPEIVVLNTAHTAYTTANFADWRTKGVRYVVDGRNFWDPGLVTSAGLLYVAPGRPMLSACVPADSAHQT